MFLSYHKQTEIQYITRIEVTSEPFAIAEMTLKITGHIITK